MLNDDEKFGVCGIIWIVSSFMFAGLFGEWGFPVWLSLILSLAISLTISMVIYTKWTK